MFKDCPNLNSSPFVVVEIANFDKIRALKLLQIITLSCVPITDMPNFNTVKLVSFGVGKIGKT